MTNVIRHAAKALAMAGVSILPIAAYADPADSGNHTLEDHDDEDKTLETIIVEATRSGRAVNDQPMRVEVIGREEIEEKAAMRPGNIATLVAETGGVRVQTTSPALGAANIRLQGLYGRYTQLLSDGLPLYGGQATSIGLLQIPQMLGPTFEREIQCADRRGGDRIIGWPHHSDSGRELGLKIKKAGVRSSEIAQHHLAGEQIGDASDRTWDGGHREDPSN